MKDMTVSTWVKVSVQTLRENESEMKPFIRGQPSSRRRVYTRMELITYM